MLGNALFMYRLFYLSLQNSAVSVYFLHFIVDVTDAENGKWLGEVTWAINGEVGFRTQAFQLQNLFSGNSVPGFTYMRNQCPP